MAAAGKPELRSVAERALLLFEVSGRLCAFGLEAVKEIVPMAELARAPGLLPLLEGILNLRGRAVPVVRFARLFDLPERDPGLYSHLIVMRGETHPVAFLVDRVLEIATVEASELVPVQGPHGFNDCVVGQISRAECAVPVLSAGRVLLEQERRRLADLEAQHQRRLDGLDGGAP